MQEAIARSRQTPLEAGVFLAMPSHAGTQLIVVNRETVQRNLQARIEAAFPRATPQEMSIATPSEGDWYGWADLILQDSGGILRRRDAPAHEEVRLSREMQTEPVPEAEVPAPPQQQLGSASATAPPAAAAGGIPAPVAPTVADAAVQVVGLPPAAAAGGVPGAGAPTRRLFPRPRSVPVDRWRTGMDLLSEARVPWEEVYLQAAQPVAQPPGGPPAAPPPAAQAAEPQAPIPAVAAAAAEATPAVVAAAAEEVPVAPINAAAAAQPEEPVPEPQGDQAMAQQTDASPEVPQAEQQVSHRSKEMPNRRWNRYQKISSRRWMLQKEEQLRRNRQNRCPNTRQRTGDALAGVTDAEREAAATVSAYDTA